MLTALLEKLGHLPVAAIAETVAISAIGGIVNILVLVTGGGKTLHIPPAIVMASHEPVIVLVPRRSLVINAAETVAELGGLTLGHEVGYAIGRQSGEPSRFRPDTRINYMTYGYAMESGLIHRAGNIVLDEVHEKSRDMSLCRAILRRRLAAGERLNIVEMSATINAERQAAYWQSVAPVKVTKIDGRTFPCVRLHEPNLKPEEAVKRLLGLGRKGIIVFRPGKGEVEDTAEAIRALVGAEVEVAELYGKLDAESRKRSLAAPSEGRAKVLVSTNVAESGMNIPWLDSGATCGTTKEFSVRPETGATFLQLVDMPQGRLEQQEGRVKRFRDGIFILCAEKSYTEREVDNSPEILRLPLASLVLYCAGYNLRAQDFTFDYPPEMDQIAEAELRLQRLGLIDTDCRLTEAGKWVSDMPVGPETGAMLWHARRLGVLGAVVPLAAVIEAGDLRKEIRQPHGLCDSSDWLDALVAFSMVYNVKEAGARARAMEKWNIDPTPFASAELILLDIQSWLGNEAYSTRTSTEQQLRQCLLAGFIMNLFSGEGSFRPVVNGGHGPYSVSRNSITQPRSGFVVGQLRTIQPRRPGRRPMTILERVTEVSLPDLLAVAIVRPGLLTGEGTKPENLKLFGEFKLADAKAQKVEARNRDMFDHPRSQPTAFQGRKQDRRHRSRA